MRWLLVLVLASGCSSSVTTDDLQPFVAVTGHYSTLAPAPEKPGVCRACSGRGVVGDGRVMMTCQACNGTGKTPVSVLVPCRDGKCSTPSTDR